MDEVNKPRWDCSGIKTNSLEFDSLVENYVSVTVHLRFFTFVCAAVEHPVWVGYTFAFPFPRHFLAELSKNL